MKEKVKLLISIFIGFFVVLLFTLNTINNITSLQKNVEVNRYHLYSNIEDYNDVIKQMIDIDNKNYNNIDYSTLSNINDKSLRLDECIKEGDIEKINNAFYSLMSTSKVLKNISYNDSNEFFTFIIMETNLSSLETKIFISQQNYNNSVKKYNQELVSFPTSIISFLYGYNIMRYFDGN